jgi:hypothetical protein
MEGHMKHSEKTISIVEICFECIFLLFGVWVTLGLWAENVFVAIVFAVLFILCPMPLLINSIKKYGVEFLIDESGVKRYDKKQVTLNILWDDIYEISLVERKKRKQVCPPYVVISKEPVDICDKKYLEMRGMYSKKTTIVMLYTYDLYTELKKYHKKDIMYYKKGSSPKKWDEIISIERYTWVHS